MTYVLDASALTAYFEKESGYETVQTLLTHAAAGRGTLFMSSVNWGEVYYVASREHGQEAAETIARLIESFPVEVVSVDVTIARQAARYKAAHKMSYADCFAAAVAKLQKATLVTGDHEFRSLEKEIAITWLR